MLDYLISIMLTAGIYAIFALGLKVRKKRLATKVSPGHKKSRLDEKRFLANKK